MLCWCLFHVDLPRMAVSGRDPSGDVHLYPPRGQVRPLPGAGCPCSWWLIIQQDAGRFPSRATLDQHWMFSFSWQASHWVKEMSSMNYVVSTPAIFFIKVHGILSDFFNCISTKKLLLKHVICILKWGGPCSKLKQLSFCLKLHHSISNRRLW